MKLERIDENTIIVFLNKIRIKEKILLSSTYLEQYFKNLFKILNKKYDLDISGYYNVTLYQDYIYGVIVIIKREFDNYFDYFDNQVDMKINVIKDSKFLYRIDDFSVLHSDLINFCEIYLYNSKLYLKPKRTINQVLLGMLMENSKIIYGEQSKQIINYGKKLKSKYVFI